MKKYFILAAVALLALASCAKLTPVQEPDHEISFQVANYTQIKADDTAANKPGEFSNKDFGTYAWFTNEQGVTDPMMVNEQVAKDEESQVWKTVNRPFYWPKTGYVDFISYSPYVADQPESAVNPAKPIISQNSIAWKDYKVGDVDLMYADKARKQTSNIETYYNSGVPTLFHHALAKVSFKIQANFLEWTSEEVKDEQGNVLLAAGTTKWEITLNDVFLGGIRTTGDLSMTLNEDGSWKLPEVGKDKAHVWSTKTPGPIEYIELLPLNEQGETELKLTATGKDYQDLYVDENGKGKSLYVLPQVFEESVKIQDEKEWWYLGQSLEVYFTVKTTLPDGTVLTEECSSYTLLKDTKLTHWGMNQNITYIIRLKPTAFLDPELHPNDPEDVRIFFNPEVAEWDNIYTEVIQL